MSASDTISPTAHYTGYVWARNGLSTPELTTTEGRILFESLQPLMVVSGTLGRPSLEAYLLARHVAIDALLERAIERDRVTQVLEVAAGLSPRGWRFAQRYGDRVTYVEADLPAMASRKREALERAASLTDNHRVRDLDALQEDGGEPRGAGGRARPARRAGDNHRGTAGLPLARRHELAVAAVCGHAGALQRRALHLGPAPRRARRRSRCAVSGSCCRRSCAGGSTCTSATRQRPRRRCVEPALNRRP